MRLNRAVILCVALVCSLGTVAFRAADVAAQSQTGGALRVVEFFVAPLGNDRWSGQRPEPGDQDGPFATVARARDAVRALLKTRKRAEPLYVTLSGGTYYLDSSLEFGPEDSGEAGVLVVYRAAVGEKVTLSGGRLL